MGKIGKYIIGTIAIFQAFPMIHILMKYVTSSKEESEKSFEYYFEAYMDGSIFGAIVCLIIALASIAVWAFKNKE